MEPLNHPGVDPRFATGMPLQPRLRPTKGRQQHLRSWGPTRRLHGDRRNTTGTGRVNSRRWLPHKRWGVTHVDKAI